MVYHGTPCPNNVATHSLAHVNHLGPTAYSLTHGAGRAHTIYLYGSHGCTPYHLECGLVGVHQYHYLYGGVKGLRDPSRR